MVAIIVINHFRFSRHVAVGVCFDLLAVGANLVLILLAGFLSIFFDLLLAILEDHVDNQNETATTDNRTDNNRNVGITTSIVTAVPVAITIAATPAGG